MFLISFLATAITPYQPNTLDAYHVLLPPSTSHWFGTDDLGRDVFSRMVFGARVSLKVGFVAIGIATVIGTVVGLIAGYYGGWVDSLLMRFVDIMLCFPTFFLILAIVTIREPSILNIMLIIGFTGWMGVSRLVRAEVLSLRERDFVLAARAIGCSDLRIIFRHILPNAIGPVLVYATLGIAAAILTESSLSFLGIGVQPPELAGVTFWPPVRNFSNLPGGFFSFPDWPSPLPPYPITWWGRESEMPLTRETSGD